MKKTLYLFLFCTISISAQLQWRPLTSIVSNGNNQRFDDVFFLNKDLGWALNGSNAGVYKTTDGGDTWKIQLSELTPALPGNYYFRNIEFLNENIGFLGTLNGVFFKTIDGGTNWTIITNFSTNPPAICGLDAVGLSTIYGCGAYFSPAYIIKSIDSGQTWQYIDMSTYANALVEILFQDENIGFASGKNDKGGMILKTIDGGITWEEVYNTSIPGEYVWKLELLPTNSDIVFGAVESVAPLKGKFVKSIDNGISWISKEMPYTSIQAVGFITENHGWMGGYTEAVTSMPFLETTDGGATWNEIGVGSNLNRIFIFSDQLAYASGTTIYKFSDTNLATPKFSESNRKPLIASVQPNPIKDKLNLSINFDKNDHIVIELYDESGRFIKMLQKEDVLKASAMTYTFDFPYPKGVYILNLHNDTGRQSIKFVK
ncbi:YCF48-related protein [Flavobacterium luteum]|uniref:T9SS type A sorting domain-containing protein n=1 Tax=Flavobacterium luteum TaxID=2026654 RepID=A0A7J5ABZ7_9FLAO|nr:YCF48-related protein [Flavobacterium luteum]KAB1155097.1 T9SS type A sorting domain-containing protein [Flavobacterium luteum]